MYAKTVLLAAVLAATPQLAHAADPIEALAKASGLTERNVRMVLGARTPYAEYLVNYYRVEKQFRKTVGEENFRRLREGQDIVLMLPAEAATDTAVVMQAEPVDPPRKETLTL